MPTKIEWAEESWNPTTGCSKVSAGCKNCYAERMSKRLAGRFGYPPVPHNFDVMLHPDRLEQPLRWRRPKSILVCSMSDLFHPSISVLDSTYVRDVFAVMALAHWHTFMILTKRPRVTELMLTEDFAGYVEWAMHGIARDLHIPAHALKWPLSNVWLGISAENQACADERIPILMRTPAVVRYVSLEPLLGPVDLSGIEDHNGLTDICLNALRGEAMWYEARDIGSEPMGEPCERLDWVICGGESGPGARSMKLDWVRGIRDQCQAAGVPFFFKQWGAWAPVWNSMTTPDGYTMMRLGKKDAGRRLDGKVWNEYPKGART